MRPSILIQIPEVYKENQRKGLCRVCAKPKSEWDKTRWLYCSSDCWWKYQECFITWSGLRQKIFKRDRYTCQKCGLKPGEMMDYFLELECDHKVAIVNGGSMWDERNLWSLCHECHRVKTRNDMSEFRLNTKLAEVRRLKEFGITN